MLEHVSKEELRRGMDRRFVVFILSTYCLYCLSSAPCTAGCKASRESKIKKKYYAIVSVGLSVQLHRLLSALTACTCSMGFTIFRHLPVTVYGCAGDKCQRLKSFFCLLFNLSEILKKPMDPVKT